MSTAVATPPAKKTVPLSAIYQAMTGSSYAAASQFDRQVAMWNPPLRSADAEVLTDHARVRARARDLYRNHPHAKQIVRQAVQAIVGKKLRYSSRLDHKFLGIDIEEADRWGAEFDRLWEQYAHGPGAYVDAGRRLNFSQLVRVALKSRIIDGETFVALEWDPSRKWKTCGQIVDADRISNPHGKSDSAYLRGGVALNDFSAPVGYYVRHAHPSDIGIQPAGRNVTWDYVPRETPWGRSIMLHSYIMERAAQTRGITEFTTVIRTMKQESEFSEADLASAIMQASYALVIKSQADYVKAMEAIGVSVEVDPQTGEAVSNPVTDLQLQQLAAAASYHNEAKILFGANRIPHLLPGEELQMVTPGNKASSSTEFAKSAVKRYAAGLGGDPIAVSQDYSDVNYSSARMSVASNWRGHDITRGDIVYDIGMPFVTAFMEEAVFSGAMKLPKGVKEADFYDALPALARGVFLASGPPMLDPVKERQGQSLGWGIGLDTLEEMCAEEGEDWREKIMQKGREIAFMREHGVPLPGEPVMPPQPVDPAAGGAGPGSSEPPDDAGDGGSADDGAEAP